MLLTRLLLTLLTNDVLPVWRMELYPFRIYQSKSLIHVELKLLNPDIICHGFLFSFWSMKIYTATKNILKISWGKSIKTNV